MQWIDANKTMNMENGSRKSDCKGLASLLESLQEESLEESLQEQSLQGPCYAGRPSHGRETESLSHAPVYHRRDLLLSVFQVKRLGHTLRDSLSFSLSLSLSLLESEWRHKMCKIRQGLNLFNSSQLDELQGKALRMSRARRRKQLRSLFRHL